MPTVNKTTKHMDWSYGIAGNMALLLISCLILVKVCQLPHSRMGIIITSAQKCCGKN